MLYSLLTLSFESIVSFVDIPVFIRIILFSLRYNIHKNIGQFKPTLNKCTVVAHHIKELEFQPKQNNLLKYSEHGGVRFQLQVNYFWSNLDYVDIVAGKLGMCLRP